MENKSGIFKLLEVYNQQPERIWKYKTTLWQKLSKAEVIFLHKAGKLYMHVYPQILTKNALK